MLRGEVKKLLKNAAGEEFYSQGTRAADLLCASPVWRRYATVILFLSMNTEINIQPVFESALKEKKRIFAPRVEGGKLEFYPVSSLDGPWHRGPFGIREPFFFGTTDSPQGSGKAPAGAGDFPALILTPGLAFDREGNRLGHGGAYYDRFFAELDREAREYTALGLCMDFQVIDKVPTGDTDKKVNGLLTGKELLIFPGRA